MSAIAILISPEAKAAYFSNYLEVAKQELEQVTGVVDAELRRIGPFEFFVLQADQAAPQLLARLSFAQGLFSIEGDLLKPLDQGPEFLIHEDYVFAAKYKGKTNERLTQMLINLGLAELGRDSSEGLKLLDPMCGRGTSLLWAMRYGITARGIEQEPKALDDIRRNLKKICKLQRQKHSLREGFVGAKNKKNEGKFQQFKIDEQSAQFICGDARIANDVLQGEKFDLVISDLPYGIQHFTTAGTRNPIEVIEQCAKVWAKCVKKDGALVLAFNSLNPKREALIDVFEKAGFESSAFSVAHRMSESILRDVCIFRLA